MGYLEDVLEQFIFLHGEDFPPEDYQILIPDENSFLFRQTFPKGFDYEQFDTIHSQFSLAYFDQASGFSFYGGYVCQFFDKGISPQFMLMPRFTKMRFAEFKRLNKGWFEKRMAQKVRQDYEFIEGLEFRDWINKPPDDPS